MCTTKYDSTFCKETYRVNSVEKQVGKNQECDAIYTFPQYAQLNSTLLGDAGMWVRLLLKGEQRNECRKTVWWIEKKIRP